MARDRDGWDGRAVEAWMVQAELGAAALSDNPGELSAGRWPDRYVAHRPDRDALKLWVWCRANGESFRAVCLDRGHPPSTWTTRKDRALGAVVALLNAGERSGRNGRFATSEG